MRDKIRLPSSGVQPHPSAQQESLPSLHPSFGTPTSYFDPILIAMLSYGLTTAAALFLYAGIVRSGYALFFYYLHWHLVLTYGGTIRRRNYIDILDDDSLLNIFYYCRPPVLLEEGFGDEFVRWGTWEYEYWWYKLAWVCRRWRRLILASPSYLGISLVCMSGTPVVDMLSHSPPFPLIIDHMPMFETNTGEVEAGMIHALKHRNRIRRIRIWMHDPPSERLIGAMGEEFPWLEYLHLRPLTMGNTNLSLPSTFRAPNLRHLALLDFAFPIGSPLLAGLVTLTIESINPSANFGPSELLQQLSLMPHLETFRISFSPAPSNRDVERQLLRMPLSSRVTLPTLRWFGFEGPNAYIEAVLLRITTPLLRVTEIMSMTKNPLELISSVLLTLHLQSMYMTENPRICNVKVIFYDVHIAVVICPHQQTGMSSLRFRSSRLDLDRMLDFTVRIFVGIRTVLTEVETLTLEDKSSWASRRRLIFRRGWRELLRSFNQVKTLHVSGNGVILPLVDSLRPHDGESALELLPMLSVVMQNGACVPSSGMCPR